MLFRSRSLPQEDMEHLTVDGKVEVRCEFCNTVQLFDEAQLQALRAG